MRAMSRAMTRADFERSLARFVETLAETESGSVRRSTLLFNGLVDSLKVLDLIVFVENSLDIRVPDEKVRLQHFKNIRAISETFYEE